MKIQLSRLLAGTILLSLGAQTHAATFSGHYPSGAEGIKAATLPPPGFYLRDYNLFYYADDFPGGPPDFKAFAYINGPRAIYMTDFKVFGANYGLDLLVPFYYGDVEFNTPAGKVTDSTFAMGDLQFEPLLLAWHLKQVDIGAGYAFWAPTGDYNRSGTRPARLLAKGFWSHMLTAGATWYPDQAKTWSLSALNRYEFHMKNEDLDFTAGDTYTVEFGLGKSLNKFIDVGLAGYYQKQTTGYSPDAAGSMDHVVGIGPEISTFCPKLALFTSLRYVKELEANHRPEGHTFTLTLTKRW